MEWSWDHWRVAIPENRHRAYCHLIDSHRRRSIHTRVVHAGVAAASISMPSSQRVSTCSRKILRLDSWLRCSKKPGGVVCLQLLGILLLLIANLSGILLRWSKKLDRDCATLRKRVRRWRQRSNRLAERSLQPNRTVTMTKKQWPKRGATSTRLGKSALLGSLLAALWITISKDAGKDVVMCEVNGAVIEPPEDADQETKDLWKQHLQRRCNNFVVKWELRQRSAEKSVWQALRQPPKRQQTCKQLRPKPLRRLGGRGGFVQCADDEESLSSEHEPECISILFANITCWGALAEQFILHQFHDCHVVSSAESHLIRERNSNFEPFLARQRRRVFLCRCFTIQASLRKARMAVCW